MALRGLLEKASDSELLHEMIGFVARRLMELEAEGPCGAGLHERSPDRVSHRNGYRDRVWETRGVAVELRVPKLRRGVISPPSWSPARARRRPWWRSSRKALRAGCFDALRGRSGQGHGHDRHLQSQVSRLCADIDERVNAFLERPIEGNWPYLWLYAT